MGTVEDCYTPELARAFAVAYESGDTIAADSAERKLKAKFKNDLNLIHLRKMVKEYRIKMKRAVAEAVPLDGKEAFLLTAEGGIKPNLSNAMKAARGLPVSFNSFSCRPFLKEPSPWETIGNWNDYDDLKCAEWAQNQMLNIDKGTAADAVMAVSMERPHFHPIVEWLQSLRWHGDKDLDMWLTRYLGVPDNSYTRGVAAKWMMSACARVIDPGCQADYTLVLEGTQGRRKSTALRTLTGSDWFSDDVSDIGSKDSAIQLQGKWIVELAELDAFKRAEMTTVKAWLVRRYDNFRPPYGRRAENFPRQNIFAASTNKFDWLTDDTGGRRFWPVMVGDIDIQGLAAAREQLWAEAMFRYSEGEKIFLSETIEAEAVIEQAARQEADIWRDAVERWLEYPFSKVAGDQLMSDRDRIYLPEVLWNACDVARKDQNNANKARVTRILKLAGYSAKRSRADEDGKRLEYWVKG